MHYGKSGRKQDYLEENTMVKTNYFIDSICIKNNGNAHHYSAKGVKGQKGTFYTTFTESISIGY